MSTIACSLFSDPIFSFRVFFGEKKGYLTIFPIFIWVFSFFLFTCSSKKEGRIKNGISSAHLSFNALLQYRILNYITENFILNKKSCYKCQIFVKGKLKKYSNISVDS